MRGDPPRQLVVDTGPLVGAIDVRHEFHIVATRGFRELHSGRAQLVLPLPILFEVYKRTAYDLNFQSARRALDLMIDGFELVFVERSDLIALRSLVQSMPWWAGSLEDAAVALTGLRRDVPVWTFNYRDFQAFPNLQFWTPA